MPGKLSGADCSGAEAIPGVRVAAIVSVRFGLHRDRTTADPGARAVEGCIDLACGSRAARLEGPGGRSLGAETCAGAGAPRARQADNAVGPALSVAGGRGAGAD